MPYAFSCSEPPTSAAVEIPKPGYTVQLEMLKLEQFEAIIHSIVHFLSSEGRCCQ
jgi:hypothetical protein